MPSADFDFLMGLWRCRHRYLAKRLADSSELLEFDGSCAARKILDGYGNSGENDVKVPGRPYQGITVRAYDPAKDAWSIYWADSRTPGRMTPPVIGGFADGIGTFFGDDEHDGHPITVRFIWSRITPQSARWEQA